MKLDISFVIVLGSAAAVEPDDAAVEPDDAAVEPVDAVLEPVSAFSELLDITITKCMK